MAGQGLADVGGMPVRRRGITLLSNATGGLKLWRWRPAPMPIFVASSKSPSVKWKASKQPLARIAGNAYVMDAAASLITYGIMLGEKPAVLSAIVKHHCTHRGQRSIIDAMDITGGKGIMLGEGNFLARAYQGAPIAITVEGANILTRSMMIFGQGRFAAIRTYWMKWLPRKATMLTLSTNCCLNTLVTSAVTKSAASGWA